MCGEIHEHNAQIFLFFTGKSLSFTHLGVKTLHFFRWEVCENQLHSLALFGHSSVSPLQLLFAEIIT